MVPEALDFVLSVPSLSSLKFSTREGLKHSAVCRLILRLAHKTQTAILPSF